MLISFVFCLTHAVVHPRLARARLSSASSLRMGLESYREQEFARMRAQFTDAARDALLSSLNAQNAAQQMELKQSMERIAALSASNAQLEDEVVTLAGQLRAASTAHQMAASSLAEMTAHVSQLEVQLAAARHETQNAKEQANVELARITNVLKERSEQMEAELQKTASQLAAETSARLDAESRLEQLMLAVNQQQAVAQKMREAVSEQQQMQDQLVRGLKAELAQVQEQLEAARASPAPRQVPPPKPLAATPPARAQAAAAVEAQPPQRRRAPPAEAGGTVAELGSAELLRLRDMFMAYDRDSNGALDESELLEFFRSLGYEFEPPQLRRLFVTYDLNKDGFISFHEFLAMFSAMP